MTERIDLQMNLGKPLGQLRPRRESAPMRLLVMGDFSARSAAERPPLSSRPIQRLDLDNPDDLMRRLAPRLELPSVGTVQFLGSGGKISR